MSKLIIFILIGVYIVGIIVTTIICAIINNDDDDDNDFIDNIDLIILWPICLVFGLIFLILFFPYPLYKAVRKHKKNKEQINSTEWWYE